MVVTEPVPNAVALAATHFPGRPIEDVMKAILEIDDVTDADLPEAIHVEAARMYLQTVGTMAFIGPRAILERVLFDLDLPTHAAG
jgi:hypothetical protein